MLLCLIKLFSSDKFFWLIFSKIQRWSAFWSNFLGNVLAKEKGNINKLSDKVNYWPEKFRWVIISMRLVIIWLHQFNKTKYFKFLIWIKWKKVQEKVFNGKGEKWWEPMINKKISGLRFEFWKQFISRLSYETNTKKRKVVTLTLTLSIFSFFCRLGLLHFSFHSLLKFCWCMLK